MKRRDILKNAGVGIAGSVGLAGVATARTDDDFVGESNEYIGLKPDEVADTAVVSAATGECGECEEHTCTCDGSWWNCGVGYCCAGEITCGCNPKCAVDCPACPDG